MTTATPRPPIERPLRVLIAEDNRVNQRLASRLVSNAGHEAVVVGDGKAALAAVERECFDVVLMDVQMPEMDGLEATAAIRARERGTGQHTPIVAVTAQPTEGDRDECRKVGMDGYLSKPIRAAELLSTIQTVVAASLPPVFNRDLALQRVNGDLTLIKELAVVFLEDYPGNMAHLREAIGARDAAGMIRPAHTIKGSAGILGAESVAKTASRLEALGRSGDLRDAPADYASLEAALAQLGTELSTFVGGHT